jgi:hypothetical protein
MRVVPVTLRDANALVERLHRHHPPARGCLFCLSVVDVDNAVRGVAIVGRPVARMLQDGTTCEVVRVATDGARNACSMLYGAAWRAARAIGYLRMVTYTLPEEGGASLRGAGWECVTETAGGGEWSRPSRARGAMRSPVGRKVRWQVSAERVAAGRKGGA